MEAQSQIIFVQSNARVALLQRLTILLALAKWASSNAEIERVREFARQLPCRFARTLNPQQDEQDLEFFLHGTSTISWGGNTIDVNAGPPERDFGQGFYCFKDSPAGRIAAVHRANQVVRNLLATTGVGGDGVVIRLQMHKTAFSDLTRTNMDSSQYIRRFERIVNEYRENGSGPLEGLSDWVFGPVAIKDKNTGLWIPSDKFPKQWVLKTKAAAKKITIESVLPIAAPYGQQMLKREL